jgi:hypothetical protein
VGRLKGIILVLALILISSFHSISNFTFARLGLALQMLVLHGCCLDSMWKVDA